MEHWNWIFCSSMLYCHWGNCSNLQANGTHEVVRPHNVASYQFCSSSRCSKSEKCLARPQRTCSKWFTMDIKWGRILNTDYFFMLLPAHTDELLIDQTCLQVDILRLQQHNSFTAFELNSTLNKESPNVLHYKLRTNKRCNRDSM